MAVFVHEGNEEGWYYQPEGKWLGAADVRDDVRAIDDVLWKEAGCTTELDYTEQTSWILFLKYLDNLEREQKAE